MHATLKAGLALIAVAASGCAPSIAVHTIVAPDASLTHLRTFRLMEPAPRPGGRGSNPILVNAITNQSLRSDIVRALRARGYVESDSAPDFLVAYYATAREALDLDAWNYGYRWHPGWGRWGAVPPVSEFTKGSVVIDLVDPRSKDLLWRGHGVSAVSDQPKQYRDDLKQTVAAIVAKLPESPV